jgi:hypothetical protein
MTAMDRGARAWLVVVAADNYWRVASWYELDDLVQDGHMIWARIVRKYEREPGRVRAIGHLMRLFRTAYLNHIHDLSKRRTRNIAEVKAGDLIATGDPWDLLPCLCSAAELDRFVAEAPDMIKRVLLSLFEADGRVLRALYRVAHDGVRETLNMRLCRLVGVDHEEVDLVCALRTYLGR